MILAIVGSRDFNEYTLVEFEVNELIEQFGKITMIVSGGADGADELGKMYARRHKIKFKEFKPDWEKFGKSAGMIRNKIIVDESDVVIAFWDGVSPGTKNTIEVVKNSGKPYKVILYNNTLNEWE